MKLHPASFLRCIIVLAAMLPASCQKYAPADPDPGEKHKVFLLYADGYSNLTAYMRSDVNDLAEKAPLEQLRGEYTVLVLAHFTAKDFNYTIPSSPVLMELYKKSDGTMVRDTVKIYPESSNTASTQMVRQVLTDVRNLYPATEYGMVFSSHGTGWVPVEYYNSEGEDKDMFSSSGSARTVSGRTDLLYDTQVKSLGCQAYYQSSTLRTYEIDVRSLADAFPYQLKYLGLDACLMGGIETAYQLRSVTDKLFCSSVEILAGGFDYENILDRLLYSENPDFNAVCDDFLKVNSEGTLALVDCSKTEDLADACRPLFEKYRTEIAALQHAQVQCFGRYHEGKAHYWYYDLRDILVKAGATGEELAAFDRALDTCVLYKRNTNTFLGLTIKDYCGLSMYLPSSGTAELNTYYMGYPWNTAAGLLK